MVVAASANTALSYQGLTVALCPSKALMEFLLVKGKRAGFPQWPSTVLQAQCSSV